MEPAIVYLSQGKLFLCQNQGSQEITSEFGQTMQSRLLQIQRNKAWKNRSIREMLLPPGVLDRMIAQQGQETVPVLITSACVGTNQQLLYALNAGEVGGIFTFAIDRERENRLFHTADFRVEHLDYHPQHQLIVCTISYPTGIANIATMNLNAPRPRDITEGDSIDLAPRWVPGSGKAIVFQSAGLGRVETGRIGDRTAFRVEKLDFDREAIETLAQDPRSDLLCPQISQDGNLYYIRRPFKRDSFHFGKFLLGILLVPLRLIHAIFNWLSFFSQMYTGKPLIQAGTNQEVEPRRINAWGDWITPDLLQNKKYDEPDAPAIVPRDWQLVRQGSHGVPEVLAEGVLSFDLHQDGTVLYTNGSGIYLISPNGDRDRLRVANMVEMVRFASGTIPPLS